MRWEKLMRRLISIKAIVSFVVCALILVGVAYGADSEVGSSGVWLILGPVFNILLGGLVGLLSYFIRSLREDNKSLARSMVENNKALESSFQERLVMLAEVIDRRFNDFSKALAAEGKLLASGNRDDIERLSAEVASVKDRYVELSRRLDYFVRVNACDRTHQSLNEQMSRLEDDVRKLFALQRSSTGGN